MRTGRPTSEKKDGMLILRLPEDMKEWIGTQSYKQNMSMSEFIRAMIREEMRSGQSVPQKS